MAETAEAVRPAQEEPPLRIIDPHEADGTKWAQLRTTLSRHQGGKLLLILTGYPDPDNIASGLAHQFLAGEFEIETTLLCFHEVSHQENRALVKRLEINLVLYDEAFDLEPYDFIRLLSIPKRRTRRSRIGWRAKPLCPLWTIISGSGMLRLSLSISARMSARPVPSMPNICVPNIPTASTRAKPIRSAWPRL